MILPVLPFHRKLTCVFDWFGMLRKLFLSLFFESILLTFSD